jgi:hypothetical protein
MATTILLPLSIVLLVIAVLTLHRAMAVVRWLLSTSTLMDEMIQAHDAGDYERAHALEDQVRTQIRECPWGTRGRKEVKTDDAD